MNGIDNIKKGRSLLKEKIEKRDNIIVVLVILREI